MLEQVKKAIFEAMDIADGLDGTVAEKYALAAIEAMMEPTAQMVADGSNAMIDYLDGPMVNKYTTNEYTGMTIYSAEAYAAWKAMVQSAINEKAD